MLKGSIEEMEFLRTVVIYSKDRRKMFSHRIEHGKLGEKSRIISELGAVFNKVDDSVPHIALNCQAM